MRALLRGYVGHGGESPTRPWTIVHAGARRARGVLVVDMTHAQPVPPEQRRRVGEWMRARRDEPATRGLGAAFVISSGLLRFVLSSVFLIERPPLPYTVVATLDDALTWARARIDIAHGRLPAEVTRRR